MELGLHVCDFTWASGGTQLGPTLTRVARTAEQAGFTRLTVMDHLWQIGGLGPPEHEMLEAYTTLGYLAAATSTVQLHALVTAVSYRNPGLLAKIISTLDVLSGGRAGLGIGAAWNSDEATGLGLTFRPPRNASSGWRRRCRSVGRCGAVPMRPTAARTTPLPVPSIRPHRSTGRGS